MKQPSILIVDDEPRNFDVIEALLSDQNYDLHYVSSGAEAFEFLKIMPLELILLDVMMPEMDGIEVCAKIKANPDSKDIPIIMVTALTAKEDLARCLNAGADDFISKPVNSLELSARVNSMLRIKKQHDQLQRFSELQKDTINLLSRNLEELSGSLASTLPHELNTPLTGIFVPLHELVHKHQNMDSAEVNQLLQIAYESAQRLKQLTHKFLLYTELEIKNSQRNTDKFTDIEPQEIPSKVFISEIIKNQAYKHKRLDDLSLKLANIQPAIRENDFQNLLTELMENAFKFSQLGTKVKIISEVVNDKFNLAITNKGRTMTEEQIAQIGAFRQFERKFYAQQGVGLGLKIVSEIMKMYEGKLSISSSQKTGTTISVQLPLWNHNV